jgi:putative flippase GtrA
MRLVRLLKYVLVGVVGLYLLAAVLYAVPVISRTPPPA